MDKIIAEFLTITLIGVFMLIFVFGVEAIKNKLAPEVKEFFKKYGYFIILGLVIAGFLIAK